MIHTISDLTIPELTIYHERNEVQLRRIYEPAEGIFICESKKVVERALAAGYEPVSFLVEEKIPEKNAALFSGLGPEIPVYCARNEILTELSGYKLTGGILACFRRTPLPDPRELCEGKRRIAVLFDIENPTNTGAIFRSAAALGLEAVLLTHDSVDPLYRRASRVSMGTVFQIPWTRIPKTEDPMELLISIGFQTAAFALTDRSLPINAKDWREVNRLAVILGNEGMGLPEEVLEKSSYTVKIPMAEGIDSLNVAAASAVAFWELNRGSKA